MVFPDIYDDGKLFWVIREYYWDPTLRCVRTQMQSTGFISCSDTKRLICRKSDWHLYEPGVMGYLAHNPHTESK